MRFVTLIEGTQSVWCREQFLTSAALLLPLSTFLRLMHWRSLSWRRTHGDLWPGHSRLRCVEEEESDDTAQNGASRIGDAPLASLSLELRVGRERPQHDEEFTSRSDGIEISQSEWDLGSDYSHNAISKLIQKRKAASFRTLHNVQAIGRSSAHHCSRCLLSELNCTIFTNHNHIWLDVHMNRSGYDR